MLLTEHVPGGEAWCSGLRGNLRHSAPSKLQATHQRSGTMSRFANHFLGGLGRGRLVHMMDTVN